MQGLKPDSGDIPPFFLPSRYKLLYQMISDSKNSTRIGRKPIPDELKKEFAAHAKEYAEYKQAQTLRMKEEDKAALQVQLKALDALIFLPDYLYDEATSDSGLAHSEDNHEFKPSILYMEQMLRLFPREVACRYKMIPAWEESLMRIEEADNGDDK